MGYCNLDVWSHIMKGISINNIEALRPRSRSSNEENETSTKKGFQDGNSRTITRIVSLLGYISHSIYQRSCFIF